MINAPFKIFISLLILGFVQSSLFVRGPNSLRSDFESTNKFNGIDYAVMSSKSSLSKSNFKATLVAPSPLDGCEQLITSDQITNNFNPVVIVTEGKCNILQKVRNAEVAGAKMLILVLNKDNLEEIKEIAKNIEYKSTIETLIISNKDGQRILKYITNEDEMKLTGPPTISYTTELDRHVNYIPQTDVVEVDYWFATSDKDEGSYVMLEYLRDLKKSFGDKLRIKPHFVFWEDEFSRIIGYSRKNEQCLSNGRYCDPEPDNMANLQGSASVLESLRQICIGEVLSKGRDDPQWWNYVLRFGNECIVSDPSKKGTQWCRDNILKEVGLDKYEKGINECMRKSFETSQDSFEDNSSDNLQLKKELQVQKAAHVSHYPLISANNVKYTGSIYNIDAIKIHICTAFPSDKFPAACSADGVSFEPTGGSFWMSFWTIIGCSLIMVTLVYCVRRSVKRQVMSNMHHEISTIVSQYKKIGDSNDDNA